MRSQYKRNMPVLLRALRMSLSGEAVCVGPCGFKVEATSCMGDKLCCLCRQKPKTVDEIATYLREELGPEGITEQQIDAFCSGVLADLFVRKRLNFEFDNPPRAENASFSGLLYQQALPIMIVAPMILYGVITAFYTYRTLLDGKTQEAIRLPDSFESLFLDGSGGSVASMFSFLFRETFGCFYPPYTFRWPELSARARGSNMLDN